MSLLKAAWSMDLIVRYSLTCLVGAGFSIPSEKWTAWWSDSRSETTVSAISHWEFESTRFRMWPATWVGSVTCWSRLKDWSICFSRTASPWFAASRWTLKSPMMMMSRVLLVSLSRKSHSSSKNKFIVRPFFLLGGGRYSTTIVTYFCLNSRLALKRTSDFSWFTVKPERWSRATPPPLPVVRAVWISLYPGGVRWCVVILPVSSPDSQVSVMPTTSSLWSRIWSTDLYRGVHGRTRNVRMALELMSCGTNGLSAQRAVALSDLSNLLSRRVPKARYVLQDTIGLYKLHPLPTGPIYR